jgi:hypothetical protein
MLIHHLGASHPTEARPCLDRMKITDDIGPVAAEVYELIDAEGSATSQPVSRHP